MEDKDKGAIIRVAPPTTKLTMMSANLMEKVLLQGDLAVLQAPERLEYYRAVCDSVGLNPLTRPFDYIKLNGKLTLYAKRECTEQLRQIHNVSIQIQAREAVEGCYVVTALASLPNGREDSSIGAVPLTGTDSEGETFKLKGDNLANAMMKAETKAKRRVTLAICGLSMMDETEVAAVRAAKHVTVNEVGEITGEGSDADAKDVAKMKIAALQAGVPAAAVNSVLPDIPLDKTIEVSIEDVTEKKERKHARKKKANEAAIHILEPAKPVSVETSAADAQAYYEMMGAFAAIKDRYILAGYPQTYDAVLTRFGYNSVKDLPNNAEGIAKGRELYKALLENCRAVEKLAEKDRAKKAEAQDGGE